MTSLLFFGYIVLTLAIFVYSYGFVDFNLTLSSHPLVVNFVGWTQKLAMFNRPLSTQAYLLLIGILFFLYLGVLVYSRTGRLKAFPWKPVIFLSIILALAYPFLSSDVFKYLFMGKIIVHYHANPYLIPPQEFTGDLWLRFMRWVHTVTPYGPVFTALSVPYYLLGFGKFVPILYLYKLDQAAWYLLAVWLIGKLSPKNSVRNQLYFALNPLVLVEWLVNAHNDAIMLTLLLLSMYLLQISKKGLSFLLLLLSIGIKYVTVIFLPFILLAKKIPSRVTYFLLFSAFALAPLLYHYSYQYQPWYVTWLVPFAALLNIPVISWVVAGYSLGALLRYLPFISIGLWEGTPQYFALLTFVPPAITLLYFLGSFFYSLLKIPVKSVRALAPARKSKNQL